MTYDRRGNSRSPIDGPPERQRVETHADDASRMGGGEEEGPAEQEPPSPEMQAMFARFEKNTDFFVGYEVPGFGRYEPDVEALRGSPVRIVPAAGADSVGEPPHRAALELAERLGTSAEIYPGDHGGFGPHAAEFAARLAETFPVE
ncbi:hypothetical protein ACFQY7_46720 [Actinomadura luteofluorescens]|uniref:Alpha/beta hydrolase n=1 Tax=Actinomadura luteofluorescens TaxID=46163 RepID=A0A7Y9EG79_9ACTN|nr:hypothetical protein [Actinomadura luteofluorescens]NYD47175.1 hypothetical protein [Actinomadura luteofluorescens]